MISEESRWRLQGGRASEEQGGSDLASPACTWPAGGPQSFAELSYSSKEWPILNVPLFHARVAGTGTLEGLDVNPRDESQPWAKSKGVG